MKTNKTPLTSTALPVGLNHDHSKLVSLLALAAGAAAMPQASQADIIYTESGAVVSWNNVRNFNTGFSATGLLPGNVQLGFNAQRSGVPYYSEYRFITGGKRGNGYLQLKLTLVTQPKLWDQINGSLASAAIKFGGATASANNGGFSPCYMAFEFKDSSQAGSPMRYGWVGLTLYNGNLNNGDNPRLLVSGWAYDTTGAQIPMGMQASVPEPGAMSLLALGALTFGAKGVRSWRRNRAVASQS
jgi:hypothetical protein